MREHILTTFIRTKWVFKQRLKDLKKRDYDAVKVYVYELEKLNCNSGPLLHSLRDRGEITYNNDGFFKVMNKDGPIDPTLLELTKRRSKITLPLNDLHIWMRSQLKHVNLPKGTPKKNIPVYFKAFLDHRDKDLSPFFSVDAFSGRVHTPVVNLKGNLRSSLKFYDESIVSLDVKQMQPTILAKVLLDSIGSNLFSDTIFKGGDVYVLLQKTAKLPSRDEAKKYLFKLIFGSPQEGIGKMFDGDQHIWVDWINEYKSRREPKNPHGENTHTNLAWLLQYSEVQVMTDVWNRLKQKGIPFLTIHDELLCRSKDKDIAFQIFEEELQKHFSYFEINVVALSDK